MIKKIFLIIKKILRDVDVIFNKVIYVIYCKNLEYIMGIPHFVNSVFII